MSSQSAKRLKASSEEEKLVPCEIKVYTDASRPRRDALYPMLYDILESLPAELVHMICDYDLDGFRIRSPMPLQRMTFRCDRQTNGPRISGPFAFLGDRRDVFCFRRSDRQQLWTIAAPTGFQSTHAAVLDVNANRVLLSFEADDASSRLMCADHRGRVLWTKTCDIEPNFRPRFYKDKCAYVAERKITVFPIDDVKSTTILALPEKEANQLYGFHLAFNSTHAFLAARHKVYTAPLTAPHTWRSLCSPTLHGEYAVDAHSFLGSCIQTVGENALAALTSSGLAVYDMDGHRLYADQRPSTISFSYDSQSLGGRFLVTHETKWSTHTSVCVVRDMKDEESLKTSVACVELTGLHEVPIRPGGVAMIHEEVSDEAWTVDVADLFEFCG